MDPNENLQTQERLLTEWRPHTYVAENPHTGNWRARVVDTAGRHLGECNHKHRSERMALRCADKQKAAEATRQLVLLGEYRQALYDWLRDGGFEPDWSKGPTAAEYYGRTGAGLPVEPAPAAAGARKRCDSCGGTIRPAERINGPALAGECSCWQTPGVDAFRWCDVCGSRHHPDNTTCDGLRGGTTDRLAAAPAAAEKPASDRALDALQVLVLDPKIRRWLTVYDPKALQQAAKALHDNGRPYYGPMAERDLCWFCFLPYEPGTAGCRACQSPVAGAPEAGWSWEVVVGNVGSVYSGGSYHDALSTFYAYVEQSKSGAGRAGGEDVTLLRDGEITREYAPAAGGSER